MTHEIIDIKPSLEMADSNPELFGLLVIIESRKKAGIVNYLRYQNIIELGTRRELEKRGYSVVFQHEEKDMPAHYLISWESGLS